VVNKIDDVPLIVFCGCADHANRFIQSDKNNLVIGQWFNVQAIDRDLITGRNLISQHGKALIDKYHTLFNQDISSFSGTHTTFTDVFVDAGC
jgi:hypothetical protein